MSKVVSKKAVIFDFDGTLADTEGLLRDIYNELAKQKKWRRKGRQQYRRLFTATVWHALAWSQLRPWRIWYLVRKTRQQLHTEAGRISLFKGIPQLIDQLYKEGWDLYVLSNNVTPTINLVLQNRAIMDKLIVLEKPTLLRKHIRISELIKRKGYDRSQVWMIGDERRDIAAARKAGVSSIAVTWGLQNKPGLKKARPTYIAEKPRDIAEFLKSR